MNENRIYDVAVIGAGPAGSTFARLAAGSGFSVLLADGQTRGQSKPCGGLIAPDAQKALAALGLTLPKSVLVDPQIFSVKTIDLESLDTRYYPRHYLNVDRYLFDRWLVSLLPANVRVIRGICTGVARGDDGVFEIRVGTDSFFSRRLVGADGAKSLVRHTFFPKKRLKHYVAIQETYAAKDNVDPFYSCIFDPVTSESCSWSLFKDGNFIFGGCFAPENCREMFEKQKKRAMERAGFVFGDLVKKEACLALRPRRMRDFTLGGGGVYLAGEAAGFISPSSFEGISSAILSGAALAEAFLHGGRNSEKRILGKYRAGTRKLRRKLMLKTVKRVFMYRPVLRRAVMRTGIMSIAVGETCTSACRRSR